MITTSMKNEAQYDGKDDERSLLQAISWFAIASSTSTISFFTITIYLLLGNLGASIVEVANDAVVAECTKQSTNNSDLQSYAWVAASIGGISGNLVGGVSVDRFSPHAMFLFFGILLILQFFITVSISEKSLSLPKNQSKHDIRSQFSELLLVLRKPEIVTDTDVSGLWKGLVIQAVCTVVPLLWASFIPDGPKPDVETRKKEE
ncbi:hypothetical protein E3N88_43287 [Mikania micrantha]|uniref:Uncharacterized protein n=1 Tax=Mikania micrantha TaxID=192012 RepID=A0A5N6LFD5_9ASTR|nr:hypothetical protein E3N88_43287 [Mikania micrantha]